MNPIENGRRLKKLRLAHGMSVSTLARLIGVSENAVRMYESGERSPRDQKKVEIARVFGVSVAELFYAEEPTKSKIRATRRVEG